MQSNIINYTIAKTIIGKVIIAETSKGVSAIVLSGNYKELKRIYPKDELIELSFFESKWAQAVVNFINSPKKKMNINLDIQGTDFQRKVWNEILSIPFGKTISYKELAEKIDKPKAVRAVANACGANKIPVLIPCHRVIASNGSLGGYSGGLDIKIKLLELESIKIV